MIRANVGVDSTPRTRGARASPVDFPARPRDAPAVLVELRRAIHADPELGFHEVRTTGMVRDALSGLGLVELLCPTSTGAMFERGKDVQDRFRAVGRREEVGMAKSGVWTDNSEGTWCSPIGHGGNDGRSVAERWAQVGRPAIAEVAIPLRSGAVELVAVR
jgi:hypothetical protein